MTKRITVRFTDEMSTALKLEAAERGISLSKLLAQAITDHLEKVEAQLAAGGAVNQITGTQARLRLLMSRAACHRGLHRSA